MSALEVRIAIVRALHGLGDLLCAVPALRSLRRAHPHAHITLIGLPSAGWFVDRFRHCLDALLPFPGFPGIPEAAFSPGALSDFLAETRRHPFDLALQLHGSGRASNLFTALLGARASAGLYVPGGFRPDGGAFFPYPERGPEIHRCLALTRALGCPPVAPDLSFPVRARDREPLKTGPLSALEPGRYVVVHPGARDLARRWSPQRFARVADALAAAGYVIVLTGTEEERDSTATVAAAMRSTPLDCTGRTALGMLAALLEQAALLVSNDTGVSHLAASVATPSVIIFLASDPKRWAPLARHRHRALAARDLLSAPVPGIRRSRSSMPEADEVIEECRALLRGPAIAAPRAGSMRAAHPGAWS